MRILTPYRFGTHSRNLPVLRQASTNSHPRLHPDHRQALIAKILQMRGQPAVQEALLEKHQPPPSPTKKSVGAAKPPKPGRLKTDWNWCVSLSQWYRDHDFQRPNSRADTTEEKTLAKRLHNASQKYGKRAVFEHLDADVKNNPNVRLDLDPVGFFRDLRSRRPWTDFDLVWADLCRFEISPRGLLRQWYQSGRPLPKSNNPGSRAGEKLVKWITRQGGLDALLARDPRLAAVFLDRERGQRIHNPEGRLQVLTQIETTRVLTRDEDIEKRRCQFFMAPLETLKAWISGKKGLPSRYSADPFERTLGNFLHKQGGLEACFANDPTFLGQVKGY